MVQLSPDTEAMGYGYHYDDATIRGFSMTHMSGPGCSNEGDVFFTPTTGAITTTPADFQSLYSHSDETATAGYYRVKLDRWDVNAELTATDRTGEARFTFPAGQAANILLPISHTLNHTMGAYVKIVGDREIEGYVINQVFCGKRATYKVNFVMTFNKPFTAFGTWNGPHYLGPGKIDANSRVALQLDHDQWIGEYGSPLKNVVSAPSLVTVQNTGTIALPLTNITLWANPGQFSQTNTCGTSVAVGTTCTISVVFKPTWTGSIQATLNVNAGAGAGTQTVVLTGTGVLPAYTTLPTSVAFGNELKNVASAPSLVTVQNTGTIAVPLPNIMLSGRTPASSRRPIPAARRSRWAPPARSAWCSSRPGRDRYRRP